jgi:hypothetical protein
MKFNEKRFHMFKLVTPHQKVRKELLDAKWYLIGAIKRLIWKREQATHSKANQAYMIDVSKYFWFDINS